MKNVPANRRVKTEEEKAAEEHLRREEVEKLKRIFEGTFSTKAGMKALKCIIKLGSVYSTSISSDPDGKVSIEKTFFKDGKRDLALTILNFLSREIITKALNGEE